MDERRKTVGRHIKQARRAAGYKSQGKFATAIGVHETSVANAETGNDRVGSAVFEAIEGGLKWPTGAIDAYLARRIEHLPGFGETPAPVAEPALQENVLEMTRAELFDAILVVEAVSGAEVADQVLRDALDKRAQARRSPVENARRQDAV